jgi:hypothetical protein
MTASANLFPLIFNRGHAARPLLMKMLTDWPRDRFGDTVGRDTDQIEKTIMMGLCYRASAVRSS